MQYRKIVLKDADTKSSTKSQNFLDELLVLKNITTKEEIDRFLNPKKEDFISPFSFCDMKKSIDRIKQAIKEGQKILIWGDFDCDGVTSSSILYKTLNFLGANISVFIPDRLLHGHGLNTKELVKLVSKEKVKLVITVDCGISNVSEVNLLKSLGVDTIITDHHSTDSELPNAYAIINPQVKNAIKEDVEIEDITSLSYNSGSVVAYKLAMALLEGSNSENLNNLKDELLIIASCGAVADVVPLIGENRAMVYFALELLNTKKEHSQKGIYRLLSKNVANRDITSYDIAFILAPRINAVGRLANAKLSFEFLTTDDENKLDIIIEKLDNYNKIRQAKCAETYDEIIDYIKNHKEEKNNEAIILINDSWHIGIIGITASKIVEEFNKPCFLMTIDENNNARCSIRSNDSINVYKILKENEELFLGFGGHALAGGCTFNLDNTPFEKVKKALLSTINDFSSKEKKQNVLYADMELKSDDINLSILDDINKLEPFGQGNEMPLFVMFDVNLDEFKLMGKEKNHLKLTFLKDNKQFQCVKWNETEINIPLNSKCDIAFYPRLNTFNDISNVQLEIVDIYSNSIITKNSLKIFDHRKKTGIFSQIATYLEKKELDIAVWAKNPSTKESLSQYQQIKDSFIDKKTHHKGLMFFDYPSSYEELKEVVSEINPEKIHLMNFNIDENLENYIKQLSGMVKYCSNKLEGEINLAKLKETLCMSENFIQIALEILNDIGSIKILSQEKVEYLKPYSIADFKENPNYEILKEEFDEILKFKKSILADDIEEVQKLLV